MNFINSIAKTLSSQYQWNFVASSADFLLARKPTPCATFVMQLCPCRVLSSPNAQAFYYTFYSTSLPRLKTLGISTATSQQVQMEILVEKREELLTAEYVVFEKPRS